MSVVCQEQLQCGKGLLYVSIELVFSGGCGLAAGLDVGLEPWMMCLDRHVLKMVVDKFRHGMQLEA